MRITKPDGSRARQRDPSGLPTGTRPVRPERPGHKHGFLCILACLLFLPTSALTTWLIFAPCPHPLNGRDFSRVLLDRRGDILRVSLSSDHKYRIRTHLADIPPEAIDAVLRYEDRFFWHHPGINPLSLLRSAWGMATGGRRMGGSTITMQVVRLAHGLETGKLKDKLWQLLLALQLECHYSKTDILEAYFNLAPYGGNVEGLAAAAVCYFHKSPAQLTPAESAALMLVPQNPTRRRPSVQNTSFLQAVRRLHAAWHDQEESAPLRIYAPQDMPFAAPHVCAEILAQSTTDDRISTTIDPAAQHRLERHVARFAARHGAYGLNNGAALLLHWPSMEIRALVGSADFFNQTIEGQIDGTRTRRSPGSTLKPMIYALALEQGLIHPHSLLADTPRAFAGYEPENFDGAFRGPLSAAEALRASRNVPAIALAARLRHPNLYAFLRRAHVHFAAPEEHYGLSLVLGGAEVSMRELVGLYAMLANKGVWRPLRLRKDEAPTDPMPLLSPETAFITLTMLQAPDPDRLLRTQNGVFVPVRLKTGTSNGYRDAWALGQFGSYILAVWVGHFNNAANPLLVGGLTAAPLLLDMARDQAAHEAMHDPFAAPAPGLNVERVSVCSATGDLDTDLCPETIETWFIPGVSPLAPSGIFRPILVDKNTGLRACTPEEGRTETRIWEFWPSDLAAMFARAGIPKPPPPPFEQQCLRQLKATGKPPIIVQPREGLVYRKPTSGSGSTQIVLLAHAEADVQKLHWFVNGRYLGSCAPGEALLWHAPLGDAVVRVVDDAGRTALRTLRIRNAT
ncbi:MAG: penicillin-binding protein 1C [Desulfovibrio sp.]|nr:penicillin-binding protein 1C [Desulfovibrio sp.]